MVPPSTLTEMPGQTCSAVFGLNRPNRAGGPRNRGQTGRSPCRKPGSDVPDVSFAPGFRPPELFGRKRHKLRQLPFTLRLAQEPAQRMPVPCPRRTRHTPHSLFESALRIRVGLSGQAGANGVEDRPRDRQPLARLID